MAEREHVYTLLEQSRQRATMAALGILGDRDAALDAVQEATIRTLKASDAYDAAAPFYPWFYRILKNHCLDLFRRRRTRAEVRDPEAVLDHVAASDQTDASLLAAERDRAVQRAMTGLGEAHREILQLRHWQDLSYEEIAAVLEVPVGTVMSRLYRARRALQDALNADPRWTR